MIFFAIQTGIDDYRARVGCSKLAPNGQAWPIAILKTVKMVLILLLACMSNTLCAKGSLYSYATEGAVHLRWNAPLEQSYTGFHIERQPVGGDWERLTKEPIERIKEVSAIRGLLGYNAEAFLTFFDPTLTTIEDAEFEKVGEDEIARSLIQLFSVKFPRFGKVLGELYSDRDLQAGGKFNYRVIGLIDGQTISWAQTSKPIEHAKASRVKVPEGLVGDGIDSTALLNWKHDSALSRSGEVVGYRVYRANNPSGPFELDSYETVIPTQVDGKLPDFLYADDFLTNGTPYWFKITGVNLLGYESAFTTAIKVVPKDEVPPKPPEGFKGRLQVKSSLLQWRPNKEPDLEGYRLYRSEEASGPYKQIWPEENEALSPVISHVDRDVPEGSILWYRVTAMDFSGNESNPSDTIQLFREDITPPAQVQGVQAVAVTEGEERNKGIHLSWEANTETDLLGYLVERTTRVEGKGKDARVTTDFFVETPEPLESNSYIDPIPEGSESRYAYRIVAVDQIYNRSEPSETVIAQMPDIVPPTRPVLSFVRMGADVVQVAWNPNNEDDLAGYNLFRSKAGGEFTLVNGKLIPATEKEYSDEAKDYGQVYRYQLVALDETGNASEPSTILSATVLDTVGPPAPKIERIEVKTDGIHLGWQPKKARQIKMMILYRLEGENENQRTMGYLKPNAEKFMDTSVKQNLKYTYFLRAVDQENNLGKASKKVSAIFKPEEEE